MKCFHCNFEPENDDHGLLKEHIRKVHPLSEVMQTALVDGNDIPPESILNRVYYALTKKGSSGDQAVNQILAMMNMGIVFKEKDDAV